MRPAAGMPASKSSNIPRLMLVLILCLSAFVQLTVVSRTVVDYPLRADAGEYFGYAFNSKHFGVYSSAKTWATPTETAPAPDKMRSPGYPFFLRLVGPPEPTERYIRKVTIWQAGLGVLSVWLTFLIAASFVARPLALLVALAVAINPHLANMSSLLLTESLFVFLLLASVLSLQKAVQSRSFVLFALTGVLWGLCSLVRPTTQYFPVLLLLAVFTLPALRSYARPALLAFACFIAILAPWVVRNQSVPEVKGANIMVNTLAHGSYPGFMYENRPETFGFPYRFDPALAEKTQDLPTILKSIAGSVKSDPATYAHWYLLGKPYFFLSLENVQAFDIYIYPTLRTPYMEDRSFDSMRRITVALHWPLMILGLAGALLLFVRPQVLGLNAASVQSGRIVAALILYAILFHMVVAPFPRYAIPFRPLLFALAALPIGATWFAIGRKQESPSTAGPGYVP